MALGAERYPGLTFLLLEPECRQLPWRCWRSTGCENSAISVGVHDTRCYRSGFQSSSSERQRERNSRSPFAAPLYFSPRQVSPPAYGWDFYLRPVVVFVPVWCFMFSPLTLSLCDDMAYIFEGKTSDSPLVAYRGQPLLLPLGHNNNRTWKLTLANVYFTLNWICLRYFIDFWLFWVPVSDWNFRLGLTFVCCCLLANYLMENQSPGL